MTRYSFTGTASLRTNHHARVRRIVEALPDGTEFTSGAQHGIDVFCMGAALMAFPDALHRVVVPAAPHDEEAVQWAYTMGAQIVLAPAGKDDAESYRIRNRLMVCTYADVLVALPRLDEKRQPRSGSWATVRIARNAGVPVDLNVLEPLPGSRLVHA